MIKLGQKESKLVGFVKDSYLEINYFKKGSDSPTIVFFPFVGYVDIKENRSTIFTEYQPISRNTTLFGYTGSKSREFSIDYVINVNHLYTNGNLLPQIKSSPSKKWQAEFNPSKSLGRTGGVNKYPPPVDNTNQEESQKRLNALSFIDYQVNLVRSMAVNNADEPTQSPPIVRLNHGVLFQDVPCICESYDISQDTGEAHDVDFGTKISNKTITLSIKLKETRTGDYQKTKFSADNPKSRDNIVGWEQILSGGSLDPITPLYL